MLKIDSEKQKMAYVRFFSSVVRSERGRFHVVDTKDDLNTSLNDKNELKIRPWVFKSDDKNRSTYEGTVLHVGNIFQITFSLNTEFAGKVEMLDDEPLDVNFPLPKEYFDGPFRFKS